MDEKIKLLQTQKEILEKYVKLIDSECEHYFIDYSIDEKINVTNEDVEKYKNFFNLLDKTCSSEVFKKICDFIYKVPKTCSFIASVSGDGGTTTYKYDKKTKEIIEVVSLDLPPFNRPSMDFIYLHEGVHGLFWDSRIGKKVVDTPNIEVLPYFFMLYALEHLYDKYSYETINSILARFIVNSYCSANNILNSLDDRFLIFTEKELRQNFCLERYEIENIKEKKQELYLDYQQFLGPVKSIILYGYCLAKKIPFDDVLNSVLDSEKEIGTELDYDLLDIKKEENFNIYKSFVKEKKLVLPAKKKAIKVD